MKTKPFLTGLVLTALTAEFAVPRDGLHGLLYSTVANLPSETPGQPHEHSESNSEGPMLIGRAASTMFSNVAITDSPMFSYTPMDEIAD